jgi:hypothetical protein
MATSAASAKKIGFVPWYFELPDKRKGYEVAWAQLLDLQGFAAPFGITTAERRAPGFRTHGSGHGCEWDGAVWPFSTAHTLTALANALNDYPQSVVTKDEYLSALRTYAKSQHTDGQPTLANTSMKRPASGSGTTWSAVAITTIPPTATWLSMG